MIHPTITLAEHDEVLAFYEANKLLSVLITIDGQDYIARFKSVPNVVRDGSFYRTVTVNLTGKRV